MKSTIGCFVEGILGLSLAVSGVGYKSAADADADIFAALIILVK